MGENPPPSVIVGTLLAIVRPQLTELTFVIRKYMNYLHRMHFKPISIFYQDGGPMLDPIPSMRGSGNHVEVSRDKKISCFSWLSLNLSIINRINRAQEQKLVMGGDHSKKQTKKEHRKFMTLNILHYGT